jgi:hypothetical protein
MDGLPHYTIYSGLLFTNCFCQSHNSIINPCTVLYQSQCYFLSCQTLRRAYVWLPLPTTYVTHERACSTRPTDVTLRGLHLTATSADRLAFVTEWRLLTGQRSSAAYPGVRVPVSTFSSFRLRPQI